MTDQNRYFTKRVISCFLRELCLFFEVEHLLCPWAPSRRSSLWACALPGGGQRQGPRFRSKCLCSKHTIEHKYLGSLSLLKKQACVWNIKIFQICLCKMFCPAHACAAAINPNSKNVDVLHKLVGAFPISYLHE